ncbi:MAG: hypothetical protein KDB88_06845 [Flavobacteriales bacterium]|nr:hypothetical protein [Flavobacteriales bacterium]
MSAAVFEARWNHLNGLRKQGHEELTDFLGGNEEKLGPAVRLGLLRKRPTVTEFQRYYGYVPTEKGAEYLLYVPEHELIVVRQEQKDRFKRALARDPMPEAPWKPGFARPEDSQNGADPSPVSDRALELKQWLLCGYMDIKEFVVRHELHDSHLVDSGVCEDGEAAVGPNGRMLSLSSDGKRYLHLEKKWGMLLVRPGMELPLFQRIDPERAAYFCGLP